MHFVKVCGVASVGRPGFSAAGVLGRLFLAGCMSSALTVQFAAAQEAETTELNPVVVEGETATGDNSYVVKNTKTGSKTNTPLREIPQSVTVVTRKQMDDREPEQLEDTIAYVAGVTASPWGVDDRYDQFLIRGFDIGPYATYRDGLPQKAIDFSGFKMEPYGLERVEVLKGPASVLYGENEVGGMVNAVTKRPLHRPHYDGFVRYGSFNTIEAGIDVGGPIDAAGTLSYRLTGLLRDGETEKEFSKNDRAFIAPAFTWKPDEQTSLTILANYQSDKMTPNSFIPAGVEYPGAPRLSRSFNPGSPEFDRFNADHGSIGYEFSHTFNDSWTVRQNLRYSAQDTDYKHLYFSGVFDEATNTIGRTAFTVDEQATVVSVDNQAEYNAEFGAVENTLLIGFDYNRFGVDGQNGFDAGPDLNLGDPDYSVPIADPAVYLDRKQTIDQIGLYAQNQSKIADHWLVNLGLRQAWVENETANRLDPSASTLQKDDALTGKIGIGYLFDNGVTPYASYSESFTTNIGNTADGSALKPSEGKQYEVGVKYEPTFFPGYITASLFDIRKTNVVQYLPPSFEAVQTGEVRHRGLELEANADLNYGLSLTASYTFLDAEITESGEGDIGNRPAIVPEHQASLWANYEFASGALEGLSLGGGVRYVGSSYGNNANTIPIDAYTLVDAALRYKKDNWQAALNVSNVFDKEYFSNCSSGAGCIYGEGRNIRGTLSVKF